MCQVNLQAKAGQECPQQKQQNDPLIAKGAEQKSVATYSQSLPSNQRPAGCVRANCKVPNPYMMLLQCPRKGMSSSYDTEPAWYQAAVGLSSCESLMGWDPDHHPKAILPALQFHYAICRRVDILRKKD